MGIFSNFNKDNNGGKEKRFIGYYDYWVILTYLSVVSATTGMIFTLNGYFGGSLVCLMFSGVCDMLDGRVASLKKRTDREMKYGIQIDSLADIISFGVFPAVIGYTVSFEELTQYFGSFGVAIGAAILSAYLLAALIRLAYFNVIEEELQNNKQKRSYYEGLPTTSVALIIPAVCSVCTIFGISLSVVYNILLIILTFLFLVKIRIPKPKGRSQLVLCAIGLPVVICIFLYGGMLK